jgi:hypothetical protein
MNNFLVRAAGLTATIFAGLSVVVAPLNALARMRTTDGLSDFERTHSHPGGSVVAMRGCQPASGVGVPRHGLRDLRQVSTSSRCSPCSRATACSSPPRHGGNGPCGTVGGPVLRYALSNHL